jgi:hypothetical protein
VYRFGVENPPYHRHVPVMAVTSPRRAEGGAEAGPNGEGPPRLAGLVAHWCPIAQGADRRSGPTLPPCRSAGVLTYQRTRGLGPLPVSGVLTGITAGAREIAAIGHRTVASKQHFCFSPPRSASSPQLPADLRVAGPPAPFARWWRGGGRRQSPSRATPWDVRSGDTAWPT